MDCHAFHRELDDLGDGLLPADRAAAVTAHADGCAACRRLLEHDSRLRRLLGSYPDAAVRQPDGDWFDAALQQAAARGRREQRRRWAGMGAGGIAAMLLVAWIVGGSPALTPQPDTAPLVTMQLAAPQTVHLAFSAAADLPDAQLTLLLPPGVELAGFPGQREVSWSTSLRAGDNVLPLTLIGSAAQDADLRAVLRHGADEREFRLRLKVI